MDTLLTILKPICQRGMNLSLKKCLVTRVRDNDSQKSNHTKMYKSSGDSTVSPDDLPMQFIAKGRASRQTPVSRIRN